jgi:hypothetical protein
MKKMFFLGLLPLSMLLLSFADTEANGSVTLLPNGNYITKGLDISKADEAALQYLEEEYQPEAAQLGFFWSCYSKTGGKWEHGRIWGGGCCTSSAPADTQYQYEGPVREQIAQIMSHYM